MCSLIGCRRCINNFLYSNYSFLWYYRSVGVSLWLLSLVIQLGYSFLGFLRVKILEIFLLYPKLLLKVVFLMFLNNTAGIFLEQNRMEYCSQLNTLNNQIPLVLFRIEKLK